MNTALVRQLSTRMKAKNLSISTLEKEAGLKTHAVRNILRGRSKRPSAESLQAIADILACTVKDLLENQEIFAKDENEDSKNELLNSSYKQTNLLLDVTKLVSAKAAKKRLTVQQILISIEEIYPHSPHKDPKYVDENFAEWFMDLMGE